MTNKTNAGRPVHFATGSLPAAADVTSVTGAGKAAGRIFAADGTPAHPAFDRIPSTSALRLAALRVTAPRGCDGLSLIASLEGIDAIEAI